MKRLNVIFLGILLLAAFFVGISAAQQQMPNFVLHAAQTLNAQYSANIDVNNVIWRYAEYVDIASARADCERLTQDPPPLNSNDVYLVEFQPVRNGVSGSEIWEAMVYSDLSFVGLCEAPLPVATPVVGAPIATVTPSQCGAMPSRLVIGQEGRVTAGENPNNLRAEPFVSGQFLGEIPPLGIFFVLDGPRCSADGAWWYVNFNGTAGWTIEGQGGTYYLEPMSLVGAVATAAPTVAPLSPPAPPVVCNPAMPSRMIVGALGRVTPGIPNNVRAQAGSSAQYLGEIPAEGVFRVLAGPSCASGVAWWQVDYNGLVGWTAEGVDGDYWIEPQFAASAILSSENLPTAARLAVLDLAANASHILFSLSNSLFSQNSDNAFVRHTADNAFTSPDLYNFVQEPLFTSPSPVLAFHVQGNLVQWLATQEANGLRISFAADGLNFQELALINLTVSQAVFSPDARYLMLVDSNNAIQIFDTSVKQLLAILPSESGEVVKQLAFSPDGRVFAAGFDTGFIVWQVNNWEVLGSAFFESPQNFQALTLNNSHFAFAVASEQDAMAFVVPLTFINSWPTSGGVRHSVVATDLALAPDSSFLLLLTSHGLEISPTPNDELLVAERFSLNVNGTIQAVELSPDGRFLALVTENATELWGVSLP